MLNPGNENDTANDTANDTKNDTKNDTRSKAWGHTPRPAPDDTLGALFGALCDMYPREPVIGSRS